MYISLPIVITIGVSIVIVFVVSWVVVLYSFVRKIEEQNKKAEQIAIDKYNENKQILMEEIDRVYTHSQNVEDSLYWEGFREAIDLIRKAGNAL